MTDSEIFCVTDRNDWIASGTSGYAQAPTLWRPASCPRSSTATSLVSSGTVLGHTSLRAYMYVYGTSAATTGAMYVLAFDTNIHESLIGSVTETFPTLFSVAVNESPWTAHVTALRNDLGLPVGALVETLGVSRQTYYDWLRGEIPNPNNQKRIAALAAIAMAWSALGRGAMARYWQLPAPPETLSLRGFLTGPEISVDQFKDVISRLGLTRRLLPPRTTKPRVRLSKPFGQRNYGLRKPWNVEPDEHD
jgi:transcriptional regulator with XRE-family HTH domain